MRKKKSLFKKIFKKKKVVIISDEEIVSLPFGPKVQLMILTSVISAMVWISYSSGKYFAYEDLLSAKEKQILTTNLTNETLQYQVTDLHRNLMRLNGYFEKIQKYDQANVDGDKSEENAAGSKSANKETEAEAQKKEEELAELEDGVKEVLFDLHSKVRDRITNLETVINVTGLQLSSLTEENEPLRRAAARSAATATAFEGQGGPFIEPEKGMEDADLVDPALFEQSLDRNIDYLLLLEQVVHSMPLSIPMKDGYMSSGYGKRVDPIRGHKAMHSGVDFVGKYKEKIYSTAPGVVKIARRNGSYGKYIEIDHGHGITTRYGHLSKILVKEGERIERDTLIGLQGSTGRSTGAHLHYEVRHNGKALNPKKFLKAGEYVF